METKKVTTPKSDDATRIANNETQEPAIPRQVTENAAASGDGATPNVRPPDVGDHNG